MVSGKESAYRAGDTVQSLVQEDPTHLRAATALESHLLSLCSRVCALKQEKAPQGEAHVPQLESSPFSLQPEKSPRSNEDPAQH